MIEQDYQNKTVLITGAASGIGAAQMETYLSAGADVIAIDRVAINERPHLKSFQLDLAQPDALKSWLNDQKTLLAQVEIFLSTAGILDAFQPALAESETLFKEVMQVNALAPIQITMALLPDLLKKDDPQIVYMASIAGLIAGGGGAAYTTSKHALVGWMRQLALDYAKAGLHVNAIAPGAIDTPMNAADFAGDGAMAKSVAADTPVQRWAQPQEVADLTLYLTSPQASYMQGQVITLDGGWTIK
ncbi:3-oxoacyl-[acyl-carrier protein] reductase [Weissella uvarum]|uniref:3-oxoacyl-ACP reductase n=1 Tax=Weissella uvarum TaxID=1479233 RepID=UPI001961863E|nr:3-oxoacyl-ACP reductase [Weissella uvarum]MBM7617034.1 3-oxoacyl-[acyl-carrier protein] reductase [Weissella uvarum]MCM0595332.1 3-oxoacyl-ACP reductase [Weissella uvarum]